MKLSEITIDQYGTAFEACAALKKIVIIAMTLAHDQQLVNDSRTCFEFWNAILKTTLDEMFQFVVQLDATEIESITNQDHRTISDSKWPAVNLALNAFSLISIEASRLFLRSSAILKNRPDFANYLKIVMPFTEKFDYQTVLPKEASISEYLNLIFHDAKKTRHSMWTPCEQSTQNTFRILERNRQQHKLMPKRPFSYVYESILLLFIEHQYIQQTYDIDMQIINTQSLCDLLLTNLSATDVVPYRFFDASSTVHNIELQKYTYITLSPLIGYLRKTLLLSKQACLFFCQKTKVHFLEKSDIFRTRFVKQQLALGTMLDPFEVIGKQVIDFFCSSKINEIFRSEMNLINEKPQAIQREKQVKHSLQEINKQAKPSFSNTKPVSYLDDQKPTTAILDQAVETKIKSKKSEKSQASTSKIAEITESSINAAAAPDEQEETVEDRFTYLYEIANQLVVVDKKNIPKNQLQLLENILERGRLIACDSKNRRGIKQAGDNLYIKVNQGDFAGAVATKQLINGQNVFVVKDTLDQKDSHKQAGSERLRKANLSPDSRKALEEKLLKEKN